MEPVAGTWVSNAPWAPTGYGTQTKLVVSRMVADGHKIAVAANYGLEATMTDNDGITVYPRGFDVMGNDVIGPYYDDWVRQYPNARHAMFTLYDVWVFNSPRFDDIPTVSWVPIDHMPCPPAVAGFLSKPNVTPVAMSRYGEQMLRERNIDCVYIPHAIDLDVFKATPSVTANGATLTGRQMMNVPDDAYVVGMFNANKGWPCRKAWVENIVAFARFAANHDDAVLYVHTDSSNATGGIDLRQFIQHVGLKESQFRFVNQFAFRMGIPQDGLAALMTACDVGLLASYGEGFGITAIEMQACETRVIVNNFSAQPELVADGWLTDCQPWWDPAQQAWFAQPLIGSIVEQLEAAYQAGRSRSTKARTHIQANYEVNRVYDEAWRPLLAGIGGNR